MKRRDLADLTEIKRYTGAGGKPMVLYDDGEFVVVWEEKSPPQSGPVTANASHDLPGSRFNPMESTIGDLVDVDRKVAASQELPNPPQPATGVGDLAGQKLHDWQEPLAGKSGVGDLVGQPVRAATGATAWDTADTPDDCFAIVPDAARGPRGNKSLRKLPLVSVERKQFDPVIVRNALTAFKDADLLLSGTGVAKDDALRKICSAARELGIDSPLCMGMDWSRSVNVSPVLRAASATSRFDPMQPTVGDLVGSKAVDAAASAPPVVRRIDGRFDPMQPTVGDLSVRGHTSMRTVNIEPGDITVHPRRVRMCSR